MYKIFCRVYQAGFRFGMYFLPWRRPELIEMSQVADVLMQKNISRVLMVTDAGIASLGLHKPLLGNLKAANINCVLYDKTSANPTIDNIEEAFALYKEQHCSAIIAIGGGSPMDCAKGIGARAARPKKTIPRMRGQLKILKRLPTLIAIPTTAGTGSETTVAAVITDSKTHEKYAINDPSLIPHYAVLDPEMTRGLPPAITAATGIDALVHAVEAYIGGSNTKQTRRDALMAVKLIFENLHIVYKNGSDMTARANMQRAAFMAGAAFTRAYVGNIHAVAHTLGGQYGTPHGLANAVIMPYVLDFYGSRIHRRLAELATAAGIKGSSDKEKAENFIKAIKHMNKTMGIPEKIADLKKTDIVTLAKRALKEANPLYPVPKIFGKKEMETVYYKILEV